MTDYEDVDGDEIDVERGNFEQVPTALWFGGPKAGAVSPGAVVAYMAVSKIPQVYGRVPKRATLAASMGITVKATDDRLDELIEKGWLLITPRFRKDAPGQTSNRYSLLWDPITSQEDPRLRRHLAAVEAFDAAMTEAQTKTGKAGTRSRRKAQWTGSGGGTETSPSPQGEGHRNFPPGGKIIDPPGATETSPLDPDLSSSRLTGRTTSPAPVADAPVEGVLEPMFEDLSESDRIQAVLDNAKPDPFDAFWSMYPRKVGKEDARKAFAKALRNTTVDAVLDGARRFAADPNLPGKDERQFIAHPATWLKRGSWGDEPLPPRIGKKGAINADSGMTQENHDTMSALAEQYQRAVQAEQGDQGRKALPW